MRARHRITFDGPATLGEIELLAHERASASPLVAAVESAEDSQPADGWGAWLARLALQLDRP